MRNSSHFSVFRDENLAISVGLRVRVYENVSTSSNVISEGEGRLALIARYATNDHRRHRRRRSHNDDQSYSDFCINFVIHAHASPRSRKSRVTEYSSVNR